MKRFIYLIKGDFSNPLNTEKNLILKYPQISNHYGDVTNNIEFYPDEKITLVANFAAVHIEPGHETYELFPMQYFGCRKCLCMVRKNRMWRALFKFLLYNQVQVN